MAGRAAANVEQTRAAGGIARTLRPFGWRQRVRRGDEQTRQRAQQREVVGVAQVADAEHTALDAAQPCAQRAVKALMNDLAHGVGIHTLGHHHAGQDGRVNRRVGTLNRQTPGIDRRTRRCCPTLVSSQHTEQSAVVRAVAEGALEFRALLVLTGAKEPTAPCGRCRQVIKEVADEVAIDLPVYCAKQGGHDTHLLSELLPYGFGPASLK